MTVFYVSSASELSTALDNAQGGDTITLAPGNYGALDFRSKFTSNVTITSADHSAPAEFTSVKMNGAQNVTFDHMKFKYTYSDGDGPLASPFEIRNSNNITVQNSEIVGDDDSSGYGTGSGLFLIDSHHINLENNVMHNWLRGIKVDRCTDLKVVGNELHSLAGDGMNFAAVQRVLIEDNHIHDFDADPASDYHRDMIQFWTAGIKEPNTDIVIRGNLLDIGSGAWTQSIFMRNELVDTGQAGREMHYKNVVIEDNTIYNLHLHGITMGETDNLVIRNNTILQAGDRTNPSNAGRSGAVEIPRMNLAETSNDVTVEDNITSSIHGHNGQSNWSVSGNVLVQNAYPNADGYYGDMFQNAEHLMGGGAHSAIAVEGGLIDRTNAGAAKIQPENQDQTGGDQGGDDKNDGDQPDDVKPDPVIIDGGHPDTGDAAPVVGGDTVFKLNDLLKRDNALQGDTVLQDGVVKMDGDRDYVNLGRLPELEKSSQIAFSITYNRTEVDSGTERLLWNHMKIGLTVDGDGLMVHVANAERPFWDGFRIKNLGLDDLKEHSIQVSANQDTNELKVYVDGKLVLDKNDVDLNFVGAGGGEWGWTLNTPWNNFFEGNVSDMSIGTGLVVTKEGSGDTTETAPTVRSMVSTVDVTSDENTIDFTALTSNEDTVVNRASVTSGADERLPVERVSNVDTHGSDRVADSQATVMVNPVADRLQVVMADKPAMEQNVFDLDLILAKVSEKTPSANNLELQIRGWDDAIFVSDAEPQHIETVIPDVDSIF